MNVSAAGILLTHDDRALFLKRSDKAGDHQGEWCCPGGSLEDGETPEQAALRETAEETGNTGLLIGDIEQIDEGDGFATFRARTDTEFEPTLDDEHIEARWAPMSDPPQPLHPGVASTLKKLLGGASARDRREWDDNDWYTVYDNPISGIGVYQYAESSVIDGGDRSKMVGVFRPPEELSSQECVNSFKLMPWTDDHPSTMLGNKSRGLVPAEEKGVHGVIGEQVYYKDGTLYGNIKVFSEALAQKIASGKRQLSVGYHCQFVPSDGVYEGTPYQYVQRGMRGNHLASVRRGKMEDAARVLDAVETLCFALDLKEEATGPREDEAKGVLDAETLKYIEDSFGSLVGELEKKGYSKEYATRVAGKVAAEKGMTGHDSTPTGDTTVADKTEAELKKEKDAADRKTARDARDSARSTRDAARDSMSSEEEEAADTAECASDAEEDKEDKDDDTKEARDRRSARDRRAGARDARAMARDKRAKDAKDAAAKGKGMDAAEVAALVETKVKERVEAAVTERVAAIGPTLRREEAAKNGLYGRLSPHTGAFDHAEMTLPAMAAYGLKKLGVTAEAADPVAALDFLLLGRSQAAPAPGQHHFAQDAKVSGSSTDAFFASLN